MVHEIDEAEWDTFASLLNEVAAQSEKVFERVARSVRDIIDTGASTAGT